MTYLLDPKLFSHVIMTLYALNALRWAVEGHWVDSLYWLASLAITAVVVFGFSK